MTDAMAKERGKAQRRADRGATLPEYAMVLALVVVLCIAAISRLQESSTSQLEDREASSGASAEVSGAGYAYGGDDGGTTDSTDDGSPPVVTNVNSVTFDKPTSKKETPANTWVATVTVILKSGTAAVPNASVVVTFTHETTTTSFTCPSASNNKGEVVCQLPGIPNEHATATMVVDNVTGTSITYTAPSPVPTQGFTKP